MSSEKINKIINTKRGNLSGSMKSDKTLIIASD